MKKFLKRVALGLVFVTPLAVGATGSAAEQIEAAKSAYKKVAKETSYQWTTSVKAIKAAEKALKAGKEDEAMKHVKKAMDLIEATALQAKIEGETWRLRVPK